ncbi:hypothetical protein [uncultured Hymenobacter sp.]|uniref:hypothetical protein n=1 Tax=uncultured Hymenobacter sp. TaxID=170016 RepID=UPI0035CC6BBA
MPTPTPCAWLCRALCCLLTVAAFPALAQLPTPLAPAEPAPLLRDLSLTFDTTSYRLTRHALPVAGEPRLYFYYRADDQTAELRAYPLHPARLRLRPSADFQITDSLAAGADGAYRATLRFRHLTGAPFVRLSFWQAPDTAGRPAREQLVSLLPLTRTTLDLRVPDAELFVGEEKVLELGSDNPDNIRVSNEWTRGQDIDYKLSRTASGLRLHLLPNETGTRTLTVKASTERPRLDASGRLSYQLPPLRQEFMVKTSRLRFLGVERKDVVFDEAGRQQGTEFILDDGRAFELHRTYRVEAQQEPGGALIAELHTRSYLTNDRVLCQLRVFNPHRQTQGYLYIKDQDQARFITNFDIAPKTRLTAVSVLHRGGEWSPNLSISPGETVDVRLEGESLQKGRFYFEGLQIIPSDSSTRSDQAMIYRLQVPLSVNQRKVGIFDGAAPTGTVLNVKEMQRPHPLNFISVDYGAGPQSLPHLNGPVLYGRSISDVVFSFNTGAIDDKTGLYGKQCLTLDMRTLDAKGNLIDQRTLDNLLICPSEPSPRAASYQDAAGQVGPLSLNTLLSHRLLDLDDWARIVISIRHQPGQYAEPGYRQQIELVLQRRTSFDIDVSFPAGLLTRRQGERGYGNFGGISLATLAQLSFYSPGRINHLRPYKIGAGFVALNAFNLGQDNQQRDLGVVILGSVSPPRAGRFTFPLYLGGGRLLSAGKWFYLLGPGIGVRL